MSLTACPSPVTSLPDRSADGGDFSPMDSRKRFAIRYADGEIVRFDRRTAVMGILNVTPDSFSDGGRYQQLPEAIDAARRMFEGGAEILDIGGESTRPGADPVTPEDEIRRVVPVIDAVKREIGGRVSVDTSKSVVARAAIDAGADMINDVSGLKDPDMVPLLADSGVPVVIMHSRGTPRTMQRDTQYDNLLAAIIGFLSDRVASAIAAGVADDKILVDPGIGFGKSADGNLTILNRLSEFLTIGKPLLVGASRKSFLGTLLDLPAEDRLEPSLAVAAYAASAGAHVIRAHDVEETVRVVRTVDAIHHAG